MPFELVDHSYGKSRVRLVKLTRHSESHDLTELTVGIKLDGDFGAAYTTANNKNVVATDTMKNIVYVQARQRPVEPIESFARAIAEFLLAEYSQTSAAEIEILQHGWTRLDPYAFQRAGEERRVARVTATRQSVAVASGIENLVLLKTTKSAFEGYVHDRYTILNEASDRIFATAIQATWRYSRPDVDFNACWQECRRVMIETFAAHDSKSVQQTLYAMGTAALKAQPVISEIRLSLPNRHCLPVDLTPFGLENKNDIFVPVDEPHGLIEGTIVVRPE